VPGGGALVTADGWRLHAPATADGCTRRHEDHKGHKDHGIWKLVIFVAFVIFVSAREAVSRA
jgi:hypothetical protein